MADERTRYSDAELEELKQLILKKLENARADYELLAAHQMKFIRNLEMALVRIENKTYGICKTTGKLIPKERLMKVPHATECIEAKEGRK